MIGLYIGCAEISDGVAADRKVSLIAAALATLTASCSSSNANAGSCANNVISTTELGNIFDASSAIIAPFSAGNLAMTVSCLSINANKVATVKWSVSRNGTGQAGTVTIPPALASTPGKLIYSTVSYAYKPIVGYTISGTLALSDHMYICICPRARRLRPIPTSTNSAASIAALAGFPRSAARWSI